MKEILGKLGESVMTTYKEVSEQTHKTVDQTKTRAQLTALKSDLKKQFQKLGECYYEYAENGQEFNCVELLAKTRQIVARIQCLELDIGETLETQKGSFDNYKQGLKSTWAKEVAQIEEVAQVKHIKLYKFCGECNTGNSPQNVVCINCGAKIEN
ncbi:MAG: hypothetical protein ATN33_08430 [Epulopiscium sp. Nele67-Bin001]|nr:MAG: hypothetical protein ATN33_08430 [Epulopiscium sp. Nele67-Bin001]